jgi:hypothetical protein
LFNFPRYLIFPDNVYTLSILHQSDVGRAMKRDLIDYFAEIKNPLESSDVRTVTLGISKSLVLGYRERIQLPWLLGRFLCDHIRSNTLHLLDGEGGEVLTFKNYKKYLGQETSFQETRQILNSIMQSWIRTFPKENLSWRDIYVSAVNIPEENLKKVFDSTK